MTPSLPAPSDTLMHQEAAQAAAIIADQYARNADTVKALAADLRRTPPPFVVTCARGSSDHAATYAKYLFETQLGVVEFAGWMPDGKAVIWTRAGHLGRVDLEGLVELGPTPAHPHGRWSIAGTIRDGDGRPLPGVKMKVATGWYAARRDGIAPRGRLRAGTALIARGEFSVVIMSLAGAAGHEIGPVVTAYVLLLATLGPLLTRWSSDWVRRPRPQRGG